MKLVTLLATSACASIIMSGCGKTEDKAVQPAQAEKPIVQNETVIAEKPKPKPKAVSVQKPPAKKALTIWDTSITFENNNLMSLYFKDNPELIDKRDFIEYEACRVSGSSEYNSMSKNEFSFEDYLTEIQGKAKARVDEITTKHGLSNGKPYLIKARISANLGDYDFKNETFSFIPISFDYLEKRNSMARRCQHQEDRLVSRPDPWPDQFHFYFDNKNAVQTLSMSKADAKILIDKMTETKNTQRMVDFDFIFAVEPQAMKFIPARRAGYGRVEAKAKIVQAKIVYRKRRHEPLLIGEYPKSFFE